MKKDNLLLPIYIGMIYIFLLIVINIFLSIRTEKIIKELESYYIEEEKIEEEILQQKTATQIFIKPKALLLEEDSLVSVGSVGFDIESFKKENPYKNLIESFTEEELEVLYTILYAEAGDESIEGQRAAAEVMLNRVLSDRFPNSIIEVLGQDGQFSVWSNRVIGKYKDTQIEIIELLKTEDPVLPCLYYVYFSKGIAQHMDKETNTPIQIGNHWFGAYIP